MAKLILVGMEVSKGNFVDNSSGKTVAYDSLKLHCLTPLPLDKGIGNKYVEMKIKDSTNIEKYRGLTLPCEIEPLYEMDYSYSKPQNVLVAIKPAMSPSMPKTA